jgi:L-2-hydroxyglutarate oxidase LhgO
VPKSNAGLGVHATLDLAGSVRLGPDDEYVDRIYYDVDPSKADLFAQSASLFMPFVKPDDLSPDTSGIRPKLQGPNEGFRDFVIREESDNGFPGLVNLIGIESPGLTASLAIAGIVNTLF